MSANLGEMYASVGLDTSGFQQGLSRMPSMAMATFSGNIWAEVAKKAAQVFLNVAKETVQAFITQEDAFVSLRTALRVNGEEYNVASRRLSDFAGELQKVTKYGDETIMSAMALGLNMGISADKIQDATRAAIGLSEAYGMGLDSAMQMLGRASNGVTMGLSRYGIEVDKTADKAAMFNQVLEQAGGLFMVAEENARTTGGVLQQQANVWGDLKEYIGQFVVSAFGIKEASAKATEWIGELNGYISERIDGWIGMGRQIVAAFVVVGRTIWLIARNTIGSIWDSIQAIGKYTWGLIMSIVNVFRAAMDTIVETLKRVWGTITNFDFDAWNGYGGALGDSWGRVGSSFAGGFSGFGEEMDQIAGRWGSFFSDIEDIAETSTDWIYKAFADEEKRRTAMNEEMVDETRKRASEMSSISGKVLGAFSSSILTAMMGSSSPERETARNTKRLVELAERNHGPIYE